MALNPLGVYPHITICFKISQNEAHVETEDDMTEHINYEDYIDKWIIELWNSGTLDMSRIFRKDAVKLKNIGKKVVCILSKVFHHE